jgi:hypothetical protein
MPIVPRDEPTPALAVFGVQAGPRSGEEIAVRSPVLTVGQGSQNDVVLADDSVSTTHARLEYEAGGWRLTDLASTNGTYLDGTRLAPNVPTPLPYGSQVRFGGMALLFHQVEAADPGAARAKYTPPPAATPIAERTRARLPVWALVLILLLVVIALFLLFGPPAGTPVGMIDAARPLALSPPPPLAP